MKKNNVLIISGIVLLILAVFMALDSNLSEIAPVFLVLGLACFGWLLYRRSWRPSADGTPAQPATVLAKISGILGLAGLAGIGLSGLSFLDSTLEEFAAAGILGAVLLVFALLVSIANGIFTKRVDAATGGFSMAVIVILLIALAVVCLFIYVVYSVLNG